MQTLRTTLSEQILFSSVLVSCSALVLAALVVLLAPHAPAVQLAHTAATHVAHVATRAG